jgi:hypothetical protein
MSADAARLQGSARRLTVWNPADRPSQFLHRAAAAVLPNSIDEKGWKPGRRGGLVSRTNPPGPGFCRNRTHVAARCAIDRFSIRRHGYGTERPFAEPPGAKSQPAFPDWLPAYANRTLGQESRFRQCRCPQVAIWETSLPRDQPTVHTRSFDPLSEQH